MALMYVCRAQAGFTTTSRGVLGRGTSLDFKTQASASLGTACLIYECCQRLMTLYGVFIWF